LLFAGSDGSISLQKKVDATYRVIRCRAEEVKGSIVDSTGAGDAYIAGIAYALVKRSETCYHHGEAMRLASHISSLKLRQSGGSLTLLDDEQRREVLEGYM
jgi:sugar/nucleoside kinase (ribokinase family)